MLTGWFETEERMCFRWEGERQCDETALPDNVLAPELLLNRDAPTRQTYYHPDDWRGRFEEAEHAVLDVLPQRVALALKANLPGAVADRHGPMAHSF
jgi:hypothetical protein